MEHNLELHSTKHKPPRGQNDNFRSNDYTFNYYKAENEA